MDNSDPNNPNNSSVPPTQPPADLPGADQGQAAQDLSSSAQQMDQSPPAAPAQDSSFNSTPEQTSQPIPDYSGMQSQVNTEANTEPMASPIDPSQLPTTQPQAESTDQPAPTPNPWDQTATQNPAPVLQASDVQTQTGGMSEQLNSANFNTPPEQNPQVPPLEPQADLPAGSIPTDSQGIPHFASTEGSVSSYSPFQSAPPPPSPEPQEEQTPPSVESTEPAPTDLSQLTANANGQNLEPSTNGNGNSVYTPPVANTDTLVVSGAPSNTPDTLSTEHKKGLPLIAIIGALVVLLIVAGASAYFILGIGQAQVPAEQAPSPVPAATPIETPTPEPSPSDTESVVNGGSSDFGSLTGEEPTTSGVFQATSAADLIKQRQQATSSPAPTPEQ